MFFKVPYSQLLNPNAFSIGILRSFLFCDCFSVFMTWIPLLTKNYQLPLLFLNNSIQKYRKLRWLLRVKGLLICFYLGWSVSILLFRQNIIKVGLKSWLFTWSSNITLSLPSYTGSALKRELNFCNGYLSLLYFCCCRS